MSSLLLDLPLGTTLRIRKHSLDNGLRVIAVRDPSAPLIAYQTWLQVGSKHERPGQTGIAHFFEHLMFTQTTNLGPGEYDRRIESIGGETNAATWVDWTYYRATVPSSALPLIVELESDRLANLSLTEEVVENERSVIVSERLERVDEDIDGFAAQELFRHAFRAHSYGWPTIGWMDDIQSLSMEALEDFYRLHYAPNSAALVVVGDFDEDALLKLVENHYGPMQPQHPDLPTIAPEPAQTAEAVFRYQKPVAAERLLQGYKAPPQRGPGRDGAGAMHPEWPLVHIASQLLGHGASAPLHRRLVVEDELASSVYCDVLPFQDPSLIELGVTAAEPGHLDEIHTIIDEVIDKVASQLDEGHLEKIKNRGETELWANLVSADGKAEALGHHEIVHGDVEPLFAIAEAVQHVTVEQIRDTLERHFCSNQRTEIRIEEEA